VAKAPTVKPMVWPNRKVQAFGKQLSIFGTARGIERLLQQGPSGKIPLILRIPVNLVKAFLQPQNLRTLHWKRTRFRLEDIIT
jgi:hypothetical protein